MLTDFILPAVGLGLSAVSTPGPLTVYLLNVTLRHGWRYGRYVMAAPLVVDAPIIVLVLLFLNTLQAILPAALSLIQLAGGVLLLWIARGAEQQYRAGVTFGATGGKEIPETPRQIFRKALMMNVVSPGPYLFWTTVNGPLLLKALDISLLHAAAFLVSFYTIFLGGLLLLAYVFDRLGQIDPRLTRMLMLVTIVLMLFFGLRLILDAVF